jgi:cyclopropane-fatty-acyl-phospholipid synthase
LWDGSRWPDDEPRAATLVLPHPWSLRAMFLPGTEVTLGRAFLRGDFDVEGDLEAGLDAAAPALAHAKGVARKLGLARRLATLPKPPSRSSRGEARGPARLRGRLHSVERDRQAISYHYDVSNEFFRLFLGPTMVYSCAYFEREGSTLDEAQTAKLDHVCRKLRLKPGQRLLDVGCGWGSLVMHAARHYGVEATGITLSERQAELAQRRIKEAGLEDRARVELRDYREMEGTFDAVASVGMVEHVGQAMLPTYFRHAHRLLKPGGVFLNHGIASVGEATSPRRGTFIARYVFPDGELVPIERMLAFATAEGFEVRDVESLREHYARTCRAWVRNLEAAREEALRHVSEETYRVWRLYMSGSASSFAHARINVYQSLLSKPDGQGRSGLPLTRADWYGPLTTPRGSGVAADRAPARANAP